MPVSSVRFSLNRLFFEYQVIQGPTLDEVQSVANNGPLETKLTVIDAMHKVHKLDVVFERVEKRDEENQNHYAVFMQLNGRFNRFMMYDPERQHGGVYQQDDDWV